RNGASENGYQIEAFRAPITRHVSPVSAKRSRGRAPRLKRQLVLGRLGTGLTHRGDWRATGEWPAPNPKVRSSRSAPRLHKRPRLRRPLPPPSDFHSAPGPCGPVLHPSPPGNSVGAPLVNGGFSFGFSSWFPRPPSPICLQRLAS